ncbi:PhoX family protein [Bordetella genomosp. 13]|uniref:Alkaline phosphatase n=1 Tax=Bordetella genomosp. 13 TaxID=463040 RepID=A0A1W6ZDK2_9BORD|nr:alkaline phosphatase PhoX [Bordetella genomosp. 13]ARP95342.1 alkaline phosphatase [Bordetella genomosp. 13]
MTDLTQISRRRLLKMLSGAPLLPLGTAAGASALLAACGGSDDDDDENESPETPPTTPAPGAQFQSARFIPMAAPSMADPAEMATTSVKSAMEITYDDGTVETVQLGYATFFNTGDMVPDGNGGTILAGGYYDINNNPIIDRSTATHRQFFSGSPDGTSLLKLENPNVPGVTGNAVFAVVQFEYNDVDLAGDSTYGQLPSPYGVLTLDQNPETGELKLVKYHNVDTSSVNGIWIPCGASLSPWNTHLSSEEYEPDASLASNPQLEAFGNYLYANSGARARAYNYGHLPEVIVNPDGTGTIKKHYCLGRISHELIQVMPDQRTCLMGDDATNGGLFMFVADREADLSAGTLYVAEFTQASGAVGSAGAGAGTLKWVKLGHATSEEIRAMAASLNFEDIMEKGAAGDPGFTQIRNNGAEEWVRVIPGMEKAAAFLETHRYAYLMGGTMWLSKNEGTTVNAQDKICYSALANINSSMVAGDSRNPAGGPAVDKTINAGGVMASKMAGGQADTAGSAINSEWVPFEYSTLFVGTDIPADELGNTCDPELPASPDNLKFSEKLRVLFIGEDSGNHVNNFVWAYNVDTKQFARLLSCPAGAEATGLHAVDEINGWTYIMTNFQHAGDYTRDTADAVIDAVDPLINAAYKDKYAASVGYITGLTMQNK